MNTEEKIVRDVIARWHDRTRAGDVDGVLELIAEDAVFLTPGHPPMEGRARFEAGPAKGSRHSPDRIHRERPRDHRRGGSRILRHGADRADDAAFGR